jgi:hypothetical protein
VYDVIGIVILLEGNLFLDVCQKLFELDGSFKIRIM